jgi:hypothetical protein
MGIDLGGAFTIEGAGGAKLLKFAGSANAFNIDSNGRTTYPNQIGFSAGHPTDVGWTAMAENWQLLNFFTSVGYNKGGGYSAGRFTAPVAGSYLLHWSGYHYKASAAIGHYVHPMFWVNGATVPNSFRGRGYATPTGYAFHTEIADIYYLNAGDYVDMYVYYSIAGISIYRYYCQFSGVLVN